MNQFEPYQPPAYPTYQPQPDVANMKRPTVWYWFTAYCVGLTLLYIACTFGGIAMLMFSEEMAADDEERATLMLVGVVLAVACIPFAMFFAAAPFLPRRKWAWIYGIVAIVIGLTSGCTMIPAVLLLIFWLQDPARQYYRA